MNTFGRGLFFLAFLIIVIGGFLMIAGLRGKSDELIQALK